MYKIVQTKKWNKNNKLFTYNSICLCLCLCPSFLTWLFTLLTYFLNKLNCVLSTIYNQIKSPKNVFNSFKKKKRKNETNIFNKKKRKTTTKKKKWKNPSTWWIWTLFVCICRVVYGLDDQRAVHVAYEQRLVLLMRVNVFGDDALGGEPLVAQLAVVAFVLGVVVAPAAFIGHVRGQLLLGEEVFHTFATFIVGGRGDRARTGSVGVVLCCGGGRGGRVRGRGGARRRCVGRGEQRGRGRLIAVCFDVRLQVGELRERLVACANVAFVGPLARVPPPVLPQVRQLCEPFLAVVAAVRPLARMYAAVLIQMDLNKQQQKHF